MTGHCRHGVTITHISDQIFHHRLPPNILHLKSEIIWFDQCSPRVKSVKIQVILCNSEVRDSSDSIHFSLIFDISIASSLIRLHKNLIKSVNHLLIARSDNKIICTEGTTIVFISHQHTKLGILIRVYLTPSWFSANHFI